MGMACPMCFKHNACEGRVQPESSPHGIDKFQLKINRLSLLSAMATRGGKDAAK
ncbi:MAG: hypothetical protein BWY17_02509 [Deltaproteobacteria bacterium ADurb.Bin207]|jgi:hypothetical protein|nr:MAG: hypothetical protein BWY17_02509 [Deltaproteobacteria bacterium ADurb.Bin207]